MSRTRPAEGGSGSSHHTFIFGCLADDDTPEVPKADAVAGVEMGLLSAESQLLQVDENLRMCGM